MGIEQLQSAHYHETTKRSSDYDRVVIAQDTSYLNYTSHKGTIGLGPIDTKGNIRGLVMHTGLVQNTQGLPLGVIGQSIWAREDKPQVNKGKKKPKRNVPIKDKESNKWLEGLEWVNKRLASKVPKCALWVMRNRISMS